MMQRYIHSNADCAVSTKVLKILLSQRRSFERSRNVAVLRTSSESIAVFFRCAVYIRTCTRLIPDTRRGFNLVISADYCVRLQCARRHYQRLVAARRNQW